MKSILFSLWSGLFLRKFKRYVWSINTKYMHESKIDRNCRTHTAIRIIDVHLFERSERECRIVIKFISVCIKIRLDERNSL